MADYSKATMKMVENTLTSNKNCEKHENGGYYLKKEDESIYLLFGNKRMDVFHNGDHLKGIETGNPKDMKEAMSNAANMVKEVKSTLDDVLHQKAYNGVVDKANESFKDKNQEKNKDSGLELG